MHDTSPTASADETVSAKVQRLLADQPRPPTCVVLYTDLPEERTEAMLASVNAGLSSQSAPMRRVVLRAQTQVAPLPPGWTAARCAELTSVPLESPVTGAGVNVPRLLLQPSLWITATRLERDRRYGLRTPLALHTDLLCAHNSALPWPLLVAEAYRLTQPDLCVTFLAAEVAGGTCTALCETDLGRAELALARTVGIRCSALPQVRRLRRHFELPDLDGRAESAMPVSPIGPVPLVALRCRAMAALAGFHSRVLLQDLSRGIGNLRRAPDFLRRRAERLREVRS